jgi:hypothetical protein
MVSSPRLDQHFATLDNNYDQAGSNPDRGLLLPGPATFGKLFGWTISPEPRPTMTINIKLRPEEEQALLERAQLSGRDLSGYVHQILLEHLRTPEHDLGQAEAANETPSIWQDLIDYQAVASCEKEADDTISLEEVRAATAKIKDSMARVVIEEERAERF